MSACTPANSINPLAPTFFPLRTSEAGPCVFAMSSSMANNSSAQRTTARNNRSVKYLTCYYYLNGGCSKSENDCLYSHFDTGKYAGRPCKVDGGPAIAGRNLESALFERKENWRGDIHQGAGADVLALSGSSPSAGSAIHSISLKPHAPPTVRPSGDGLNASPMNRHFHSRPALAQPKPNPIDDNARSLAELVKTSIPDFERPIYGTCGPVGGPVTSNRVGPPQENIFGPITTANPINGGSSPFHRKQDRSDSTFYSLRKTGLHASSSFASELVNTPPNRHTSLAATISPFSLQNQSPQGNLSEHHPAAGTAMLSSSSLSGEGPSPKNKSLSKLNSPNVQSNAAGQGVNSLLNKISNIERKLYKTRERLNTHNETKELADSHELMDLQRRLEQVYFETLELQELAQGALGSTKRIN